SVSHRQSIGVLSPPRDKCVPKTNERLSVGEEPMRLRRAVVLVQALLLLVAGCGGSAPAAPSEPSAPSPSAPSDGSDGGAAAAPPPLLPEDMVAPDAAACVRTVSVAKNAALAPALAAAHPGDCITLADGQYTFPRVSTKGTAAQPIVIRAAHVGAA